MKKYTWILGGLMAMAITACTSDELMERPEQHPTEGEVVSVTAYVPGNNPDSRVAFTEIEGNTDSYTLSWETLDQFSVIRDGQSNTFRKEAGNGNTFTGVLPGSSGEYYAIYPAIAEGDADASVVPFDLSTQTGALNASKTYMRATSTDNGQTFSFSHCMSILKASFSFTGLTEDPTIEQIKVITPDAYKVNGTIDLSTGTLTGANGGTNIITISGNAITAPYYIYLPPMAEGAKTFTIEVTAGDKTYKGTISRNDAIVAGKLYTATINLTETYCYLPNVSIFREAVLNLVTYDTQAIRFIANSAETGTQIGTSSAYMKLSDDGTTLEIHTAAKEGFVLNADCSFMFSGLSEDNFFRALNSIDFNGCVNTANVTNMSYMFFGCTALNSLNLSSFNTDKVTDMSSMFYYCSSLNSLNLSSFNTEKVTNMSSMFYYCSSLNSLDLSDFNTEKVTDMSSMFYYCSSLNSLNLSSFNTDNVTDMSYMFSECTALTSIDFNDRFNTANVTNMSYMFYNCSSLNSLDLSDFNTEKVTNMSYMFYLCSSLTSLDLSDFNTENVTNMSYMFYNCSSLNSLNFSSFNTANVTNMSYMFYNCSSLNSLDLSYFNTEKVTDMSYMFYDCSSLNSLDIQNFNIGKVNSIDCIFFYVGYTYKNQPDNKAKIKVKMDLWKALESKSVNLGNLAEYVIIDEQPM